MAEWLKAHAWKACIQETVSRVRIPVSPPSLSFPGKIQRRLVRIPLHRNLQPRPCPMRQPDREPRRVHRPPLVADRHFRRPMLRVGSGLHDQRPLRGLAQVHQSDGHRRIFDAVLVSSFSRRGTAKDDPQKAHPFRNQSRNCSARLDQFRSTQSIGTKLPEPLWQAAVELAPQHGVYAAAHPLRLDYMGLKKRLGGSPRPAAEDNQAGIRRTDRAACGGAGRVRN